MRRKRKKEVTSETAFCFSLKKRKNIFCRKSFFTTKHKILKRQKKATIEADNFDETYYMKKATSSEETHEVKKEKRSNI